ncbi:GIY-YIG nuclease family protein [Phenylobacterium sp.]|uniref:GIY-YIG nuclease family protein n=1 Tax=Phenylobacterium sp. TaxID=1871053 RepID=UPI003524AD1F
MFYTYLLASKRNGTLYAGSTDDLAHRICEHREKARAGFTARYGVNVLVWFEAHESREAAFRRERRIKEWRRSWKLLLIEDANPTWRDLRRPVELALSAYSSMTQSEEALVRRVDHPAVHQGHAHRALKPAPVEWRVLGF